MAIFYSILEDSVAPSADIYSQISSLVTLQLVGQLHTKDLLDGPKYKVLCCAACIVPNVC
jgi:origin recognition complex subunit 5